MTQFVKEVVEMVKLVLQRRSKHRTVEQVVDVLVRQILEEINEAIQVVCPERVAERIEEHRKLWSRASTCQVLRLGRKMGR